ncbi:hypothetical protein CDIK_1654 [Cucumispora dikerogammari]|nr:hypothetical protein CDIK_1654 [Cucumispora dikerogammari]
MSFIFLLTKQKNSFKDCKTHHEILKRYSFLKQFPFKDLKTVAQKALKNKLKEEIKNTILEALKGDFTSIDFYKKMNLIVEYKMLLKIQSIYLMNEALKKLIKFLRLDNKMVLNCKIDSFNKTSVFMKYTRIENFKTINDFRKIKKLVISNNLNTKNFSQIKEFYKNTKTFGIGREKTNTLEIGREREKKITKKIFQVLLISLKNKEDIIFSDDEKKFLKFVSLFIKKPKNFLKKLYRGKLEKMEKTTNFLFEKKLFNKKETGTFLNQNFENFLETLKEIFIFGIKRPKNLHKLYLLIKMNDKKKAEILENYIYILICNFILRNMMVNSEEVSYFEKLLAPFDGLPHFKIICLINRLYLSTPNEMIDKSLIRYFPPFVELKLDYFQSETPNKERLDLFCFIKIRIEGEIYLITLVQFLLFESFLNELPAIKNKEGPLTRENLKYFYLTYKKNSSMDSEEINILKPHFRLIDPVINRYFSDKRVKLTETKETEETEVINLLPNFYEIKDIQKEQPNDIFDFNVNSNIMKVCKKEKHIDKLNLYRKLSKFKISYAVFLKGLNELEKKGYLCISDEFIKYVP